VILNDFFKITPDKRHVKIKKKVGVIYSNPRWWKKIIFYFGSFLAIFSLVGILYIYTPIIKSWVRYKLIDQNEVIAEIKRIRESNQNLNIGITQETTESIEEVPVIEEPESNEFRVEIPKIGADSDIVANVSPINKEEYLDVLKSNVIAHSSLSSLPGSGMGSTVYLFAHSSQQGVLAARDNSVFYLLGELQEGDDIFVNYKGKIFTYRVYTQEIISAKDSEYLKYVDPEKEILILQTCWPIGTNWQRLLVFAERI